MLRLRSKTDTKNVSRLHYPFNTLTANSLYRLGKELLITVSLSCIFEE